MVGGFEPTAIIVVNYGSHQLLRDGLASVVVPAEFRVVVVDNASTSDERRAVERLCRDQGWTLVPLADNGGFGTGVNAGLRRARADGCATFLLLNPDVTPDPAVFAALRAHVLAAPDTLVSPVLRSPDGRVGFAGSALDLRSGRIRGAAAVPREARGDQYREWLPATCLALHRDLLDRVGGFDEPYFMYWEDVDFSYRCASAGARLVVRDDLAVVHTARGTQGPRRGAAKSNLYYRYNCRNRLLFGARHLARRELARWVLCTPAASWLILMQGGRRQLLHSPRPLLATLTGSLSGLVIACRALVEPRRLAT